MFWFLGFLIIVPPLQFKVLRDGCWAKINFRRGESALNNVDESRDLSVNPWIRHFRYGRSHHSVTNSSLQGKTAVAATNRFLVSQPQLCRHDSIDSNTGSSHLHLNVLPGISLSFAWSSTVFVVHMCIYFSSYTPYVSSRSSCFKTMCGARILDVSMTNWNINYSNIIFQIFF